MSDDNTKSIKKNSIADALNKPVSLTEQQVKEEIDKLTQNIEEIRKLMQEINKRDKGNTI